jgi:hypothetical protein
MSTEVEFDEKVEILEKAVDSKNLVVYNDDVNKVTNKSKALRISGGLSCFSRESNLFERAV